jgi:hypothetical protein
MPRRIRSESPPLLSKSAGGTPTWLKSRARRVATAAGTRSWSVEAQQRAGWRSIPEQGLTPARKVI